MEQAEIAATNRIAAMSSTLATPVRTRLWNRKWWFAVASAVLLIVMIAGLGFWTRRRSTGNTEETSQTSTIRASPIRSIAVMPFIPRGIPDKAYLGDSIAEEVATSLAQYSKVRVASYTSSRNLSNSQPSTPQIAQLLKVNDVLEGSVVGEGDQVASSMPPTTASFGRSKSNGARTTCLGFRIRSAARSCRPCAFRFRKETSSTCSQRKPQTLKRTTAICAPGTFTITQRTATQGKPESLIRQSDCSSMRQVWTLASQPHTQ
jgi:TolB-like protein